MNVSLIMTVIGPDRPGLVGLLATTVAEHDGNWLESRMSHLAGQFAGICRVTVPQDKSNPLVEALNRLASEGLRLVVETDGASDNSKEGRLAQLELVGHDRAGIVQQISQAIAARGVNVEELNTECTSAPMTGENLFRATATLRFDATVNLDQLREDLETIGQELMVEVSVQEA